MSPDRVPAPKRTPRCVWFTGLSGSGKSPLAQLLEQRLQRAGLRTCMLDGDPLRQSLSRDLGFTPADRSRNVRRVAQVAQRSVQAGLTVLVALISPFRADRQFARELFAAGEFLEVFVDAPLAECERRDPKGLYARARRGELKDFTGIDSAYEAPLAPDVQLQTSLTDPAALLDRLAEAMQWPRRRL